MQKGIDVTNFQAEKALVQDYYTALDAAQGVEIAEALSQYLTEDHKWLGYYPFYEFNEIKNLAAEFWAPFKASVTSMQRRQDVFFAGTSITDQGGIWVVSMGHLMGLFDQTWLGIRPTGKMVFMRYSEFLRVENGKIMESAFYYDLPHFMAQAGCNPFHRQTGAELVQPGPITHGGLLFDAQDPEVGKATLDVIEAMISDLGGWDLGLPLEDELRRTWTEDMIWWGPTGIGATYTIPRYAKQHSGPFRAAFKDRSATGHVARLAEGNYGGFFGRPNFTAEHIGGLMGMPATGKSGEFRVIDIYRRDGDKLAENWIFIDLLHYWKEMGVDLFERAITLQDGPR